LREFAGKSPNLLLFASKMMRKAPIMNKQEPSVERMTRFLATLALCAAFSVTAFAADDEIATQVNIPYETFRLDNGLTVIVHTDHSTPTVFVGMWYGVGSKNEPEGKSGFAHLFEHLMFQGTENREGEYFSPFTDAGATGMNGTTSEDRTNYFATVPTGALDMALWMESDRMSYLLGAVTQEALDEQRGVVQNEKRQGENRPYAKMGDRIRAGVYPVDHPYRHSIIGSMEDLDAASLEDVHEWFDTYCALLQRSAGRRATRAPQEVDSTSQPEQEGVHVRPRRPDAHRESLGTAGTQ
jgi:hypothetical protein